MERGPQARADDADGLEAVRRRGADVHRGRQRLRARIRAVRSAELPLREDAPGAATRSSRKPGARVL